MSILEQRLREAAARKGSPLSVAEVEVVGKEIEVDELRERFRKVVRGAGYQGDRIVEEWFPRLLAGDRKEFIAMMEDYEKNDYDP